MGVGLRVTAIGSRSAIELTELTELSGNPDTDLPTSDSPTPPTNTNPASRAGHVREGEGVWVREAVGLGRTRRLLDPIYVAPLKLDSHGRCLRRGSFCVHLRIEGITQAIAQEGERHHDGGDEGRRHDDEDRLK